MSKSIKLSIKLSIDYDWKIPMVRTISATEAKVNFGSVTRQVIDTDEPVIVESHGQPTVAIVPAEHVNRLREFEEEQRRREALERMRQLRARVRSKNVDLTDEQAEQIADDIVRDAVDALFEKGIVRYAD